MPSVIACSCCNARCWPCRLQFLRRGSDAGGTATADAVRRASLGLPRSSSSSGSPARCAGAAAAGSPAAVTGAAAAAEALRQLGSPAGSRIDGIAVPAPSSHLPCRCDDRQLARFDRHTKPCGATGTLKPWSSVVATGVQECSIWMNASSAGLLI